MNDSITIATWNVDWASPRMKHYQGVRSRIEVIAADILVLTEALIGIAPEGGHYEEGGDDWGYERKPNRRKVLLWSRWSIEDVSNSRVDPPGRCVSGTVASPIGDLRVHAVCVPWSHAHVTSGRKDRKAWDEHLAFLESLARTLRCEAENPEYRDLPVVIAGDINQRTRLRPGSARVREAWAATCAAANLTESTDVEVIDKVAISPGLVVKEARVFPREDLSDHDAVSCRVAAT